ncbi:MAG TPA: hypothetical protein VL126_10970 [Bacteroidota bacterium]|nr:hypothetical protein [Bacteroidota bacterium]
MKARTVILIGAFAALLVSAAPVSVAQVRVGIGIQIGPPPARQEVVLPRPTYPAVWVRGYWSWDPGARRHVWVPGKWVAERPGYRWVDGGWRHGPRGWVWTEGRWKAARGGRAGGRDASLPRPGMRR